MTVRFLGGVAERRRRFAFGPAPTFKQDFVTGGGGALPQGATFSRGTIGTLYNQSGLVAYAPSNLLLYSNTFTNAAWTLGVTLNSNNNVAPDATLTAQQITFTASSGYLSQQYNTTQQLTAFTFSLFIRSDAPTTSQIQIQENGGVNNVAICNVTTLWQRFTVTYTTSSAVTFIKTNILANSNTPTLYVWGAQLEQGSNATTYTPTTTAAVYGPRFDYDPNNVLQQNLLLSSNFDAANIGVWASGTPTGYTLNVGIAPDGTSSAMFWAGAGRFFQENQTALNNNIYTASIWIRISSGAPSVILAIKDKQTDSIRGSVTASPTSDWQRINCTGTTVGAQTGFRIEFAVSGGTAFFWGAQVNIGSTALPYLATTSTAQTVCAPRGLLIEEARTNSLVQSENFGTTWATASSTVATNSTTAPDGNTTADKVTSAAATAVTGVQQALTGTAVAWTASVYAKANGAQYLQLVWQTPINATDYANFDLLGGAVTAGTNTSSSIQYVGNGWYRCTITSTLIVAGGALLIDMVDTSAATRGATFTGDGTKGVYLWGAQSELGAFATSYIPTTSATVTRNADNLSITSIPWFNASVGSFVAQFDTVALVSYAINRDIVAINGVTGTPRLYLSTASILTSYDGLNYASGGSVASGGPFKSGWTYGGVNQSSCLGGAAPITSNFIGSFSGAVSLSVGTVGASEYLNGHIRSFSYYNYTLTNAQLQQVTT